jgi:hypothetical protein
MLFFTLVFACGNPTDSVVNLERTGSSSETSTFEPWRESLPAADMVGAADWTGDGLDERVRFVGEKAFWDSGSVELGGAPQVIRRVELSDGERLLVGTGMHRGNRESLARVWSFGPNGAEKLWESAAWSEICDPLSKACPPPGVRNQIADIRVLDGRVYISRFTGQKEVSGGFLVNGEIQEVHGGGLVTQQIPVADDRVLVGRVYGEKPRSDGDLRLIQGGKAIQLPSLRGVRTLTLENLDSDPELELLVGDGWHYAYGQQAVGRVFLLDGPLWKQGRTLAVLDGEYSARSIEVASKLTGGDPSTSGLLVTGTKKVHFLTRDALGWADRVVAPTTETGNAVLVRTPKGLAAWVAGTPNTRLVGLDEQ